MKTKNIEIQTLSELSEPVKEIIDIPRPVVAFSKDFEDGHVIDFHKHWRAQLLYASKGVMTVTTENGIWVVPPFRGVWIPGDTVHKILCSGELQLRTLYLDPKCTPEQPKSCQVLSIPPLLRELILEAMTFPHLYPVDGPETRLIQVILDQIHTLTVDPLDLPLPRDPRLIQIYDELSENPADNRTLEAWAKQVNSTSRTLLRLFRNETGMSFNQWRQQMRILVALRQLGRNEAVTTVALNLGYNSPSAFISMFKKLLGETPSQYFKKG